MKKFFFFIFIGFILFSCKKQGSEVLPIQSEETLRSKVLSIKVDWEDELEGDFLQKKIERPSEIKKNIRLSSGVYIASSSQQKLTIYPDLKGFGSLDSSKIPVEALSILSGFSSAICKNELSDSFISSDNRSTLVFFLNDLKRLFPSYNEVLFSQFFLGKPFETENDYEVPIRLSGNGFFLDLHVYLNKNTDWKINQIQIFNYQEMKNAE